MERGFFVVAHLLPPYAGQGMNITTLNASKPSNSRTSLLAAIAYHMRQRAAVVHDTMEQTAALHAAGGLAYLVGLFSGG